MELHRDAPIERVTASGRRPGGRRVAGDVTEVHWHTHRPNRSTDAARRAEGAREEIEAAIMLVAGGHFPRVLISNLPDCARAVRDLRGLAEAVGVELETLPRRSGRGCDLAVTAR